MFKLKIHAGRWGEGNKENSVPGKPKAGQRRTKTMHASGGQQEVCRPGLIFSGFAGDLGDQTRKRGDTPHILRSSQLTANYFEMMGKENRL